MCKTCISGRPAALNALGYQSTVAFAAPGHNADDYLPSPPANCMESHRGSAPTIPPVAIHSRLPASCDSHERVEQTCLIDLTNPKNCHDEPRARNGVQATACACPFRLAFVGVSQTWCPDACNFFVVQQNRSDWLGEPQKPPAPRSLCSCLYRLHKPSSQALVARAWRTCRNTSQVRPLARGNLVSRITRGLCMLVSTDLCATDTLH